MLAGWLGCGHCTQQPVSVLPAGQQGVPGTEMQQKDRVRVPYLTGH